MYKIGCYNDIGIGNRTSNDDCGLVGDRIVKNEYYETCMESPFCAVFDGVGGEAYGEEAALLAAKAFTMVTRLEADKVNVRELEKAALKAHLDIIAECHRDIRKAHMSTTVAGIYVHKDDYIALNVGDSRAYIYKRPYIQQITVDHSVDEYYRAMGLGKREPSHVITRCLGGINYNADMYEGKGKVRAQDMIILTSDGVSDVLTHYDIEKIIERNRCNDNRKNNEFVRCDKGICYDDSMKKLCHDIILEAKNKGSEDNMTVIVMMKQQE